MNDAPIQPTTQNTQRYTALLVGSVTAITLAGMVALVSIKPQLYLSSKGAGNQPLVQEIPTLIADCQLVYTGGCHDSLRLLDPLSLSAPLASQLHEWGRAFNINPQVVIVLGQLENTTNYQPIFEKLSILNNRVPQELPKVYTHPTFGTFKLTAPTHDTLVLVNYVAMAATSKQVFISTVATENPQGPIFVNTYKELFQTDPTSNP